MEKIVIMNTKKNRMTDKINMLRNTPHAGVNASMYSEEVDVSFFIVGNLVRHKKWV